MLKTKKGLILVFLGVMLFSITTLIADDIVDSYYSGGNIGYGMGCSGISKIVSNNFWNSLNNIKYKEKRWKG